MGMYTELAINVKIRGDSPAVDLLRKMTKGEVTIDEVPESERAHPFFKTERWNWCLRSGGSYYFHSRAIPSIFHELDEIDKTYGLTVWTNIKNYTDEWENFLDWLMPHLDADGIDYIGHIRYEDDDIPTLLFNSRGKLVQYEPKGALFDPESGKEITC